VLLNVDYCECNFCVITGFVRSVGCVNCIGFTLYGLYLCFSSNG